MPEALGLGNWVKAQEWAAIPGGQATYLGNPVPWGTLPTILVIEFLAISFVEHQRSMEKDTEKKKYPGGAFDPLGYSKDPVKFEEYKVKEIKNGLISTLRSFISYHNTLIWYTCLLTRSSLIKFCSCCLFQAGSPCWPLWDSASSNRLIPEQDHWKIWRPTWPIHGTTTLGTSLSLETFRLSVYLKFIKPL